MSVIAAISKALPSTRSSHAFVEGYVPVAIDREVRQCLVTFRELNLDVDLRIERALVSAAVCVALDSPDTTSTVRTSVLDILRSTNAQILEAALCRACLVPVLIRREAKARVRLEVAALGPLPIEQDAAVNLVTTTALSLMLSTSSMHSTWIDAVAQTVGLEVHEGYAKRRALKR